MSLKPSVFIIGAAATPSGETKEFSFASPPVSKNIGRLEQDAEDYVDLFMRASTTGKRGVEVKVSYNLGGYSCDLSTEEVLDTVEPFEVSTFIKLQ